MEPTRIENERVLVTERPTAPPNGIVLGTGPGDADVEIVTMRWWTQVLIRVARTYLQSLVGFILAAGSGAADAVGVNMPANDFVGLLYACASLSVAPAVISLLQNGIEILSRLDTSSPKLRA